MHPSHGGPRDRFGMSSPLLFEEHKGSDSARTVVTEVQTLKAEVEVLKRSFEEEKEARMQGDDLSGEAVLQLQAVLELEGKKRQATINQVEETFRALLSRLFDEMSELKQGMESRPPEQVQRDIGSTSELRTIKMELDREIKRRFDELDRYFEDKNQQVSRDVGSTTTKMELDREMKRRFDELDRYFEDKNRCFEDLDHCLVDTNRRVEDSNHRLEEFGRSMNCRLEELDRCLVDTNRRFEDPNYHQISRNPCEPGVSELMHRLNDERAERERVDNAMHQHLTLLAEQTDLALKEEASRLWEALRTHNHDIMIDTADQQPGQKKFQIQAKTNKSPQTINLSQSAVSPAMPAHQLSTPGSPVMNERVIMPGYPPSQRALTPTVTTGQPPTHTLTQMSGGMRNLTANEPGVYHQDVHQFANQFPQQDVHQFANQFPQQDVHQFANQFPQQSTAFYFGENSQYGNWDQQPQQQPQSRIRLPGF